MKKNIYHIFVLIVATVIGLNNGAYACEKCSFFEDYNYRKELIKESELQCKVSDLKAIAGPVELKKFVKSNNNKPDTYIPTEKNREKGLYRANLHMHSLNSDGSLSMQKLLDDSNEYAKTLKHGKFYIATTDHNTTDGAKEALKIISENPQKYKKLKVVLGIEVYSTLEQPDNTDIGEGDVHVLCWTINPYSKVLNETFKKENPDDKWNYSYRTFDDAVKMLQKEGLTGVAHPLRTYDYEEGINYLLERYKDLNQGNFLYTEGYYQPYNENITQEMKTYTLKKAKELKINSSGSLDTHSEDIFAF